jgi:DNA-binding NarL/FixJ family response regulator
MLESTMRALICHPNALMAQRVAQVVAAMLPHAVVTRASRQELALFSAQPEPLLLAIVAHPWVPLAALRRLAARHPSASLVIVADVGDISKQHRLLRAPVAAIVPDTASLDTFAATLRVVLHGGVTVKTHGIG